MINAIYLLICSASNWLFSQYCAWDDTREINQGITIKHRHQWVIRAVLAFCVAGIIANAAMVSWSVFGVSLIGIAFQFSAMFRYYLNKRRKLDWWYISNKNKYSWYDRVFIWIGQVLIFEPEPDLISMAHFNWAKKSTMVGGKVAYITEVLITIAAFVVAIKLG
ncbi:MAG TPA: hypothetical protein PLZ24_16010 [Flavobacteriales bacterium]|nr:hypothetical protein [Flavobacteriales bacterium]